MNTQISIFDGANKFVNDKPIRLIECFAGYGSQALALKYLGIPFEHHRIAEWAKTNVIYKTRVWALGVDEDGDMVINPEEYTDKGEDNAKL